MKRKKIDYAAVIEAARSGELERLGAVLVFDNDDGWWRCWRDGVGEEETERAQEELNERFGRPSGYGDLVDLAIAAGINAEWC